MSIYRHHCHPIKTNAVLDVVATAEDPVTEPVTLAEVKEFLRIQSNTTENASLTSLITEARQWVERRCGISIVAKGVTAILEIMNEQELPYGPISDLESITVVDDTDETVTNYTIVGLDGGYPVIRGYGRYTVSYDAGMAQVPEGIKGAIKSYVAFAYENRGDEIDESDEPFAKLARKKSNPYKRTIGF